jgi:membrane protein DedA with SNARE-associated domain
LRVLGFLEVPWFRWRERAAMRLMLLLLTGDGAHVQAWYVYGGVFGAALIQSLGIPFPTVVVLVAAAVYASTVSTVSLVVLIAATILGGLIGSSVAFALGLRMGERVLGFAWRHLHLSERKVKLGIYLLERYDWQILVMGRFVSVIRPFQGYLAGSVRLTWRVFLLFTGIGLALWASVYALGAYLFGSNFTSVRDTAVGKVVVGLVVVVVVCGAVLLYRSMERLEEEAERVMPGSLGPPFQLGRSADVNGVNPGGS